MPKKIETDPIFINNFPNYSPAIAQRLLINTVNKVKNLKTGKMEFGVAVDDLFLFISRQTMKSITSSTIFWERMMYSALGEDYVVLAPLKEDVESKLIGDILLEAFGGADIAKDLNSIYLLPPNQKFMDKMHSIWEKNPGTKERWLTNKWLIIREGKHYIKLFQEELSDRGSRNSSHYTGKLFTGAKITCFGAGNVLEQNVRGMKLKGCYAEEIGEYSYNPFGAIRPALNSQDGWLITAGTPNERNPLNWVYEDLYDQVVNSDNRQYAKKAGLDFYAAKKEVNLAEDDEDDLESLNLKDKYQLTVIGKITDIWPYIYNGKKRFLTAQQDRKHPDMIEYIKDGNGEKIVDEDSIIKNKDGEIINKTYKFRIVPAPKENPGISILTEEKYKREYLVDFLAGESKAFHGFSLDHNIIPRSLFNESYYQTISGYDHGSFQGKIIGDKKGKQLSASCWVKVAVRFYGNSPQFIIYDEHYIESPNEETVSSEWKTMLREGIPIVFDFAIANNNGTQRSLMGNIIQSDEDLSQDQRIHRGLFKCLKGHSRDLVEDFNNWFVSTKTKDNIKFRHPIDINKDGRKLYITDNCKNLIQWFDKQNWMRKNKSASSVSYTYQLADYRDDLWDACYYPILFLEKNYKDGVRRAKYYWENNSKWRKPGQESSKNLDYYSETLKAFGVDTRQISRQSVSNRRWNI